MNPSARRGAVRDGGDVRFWRRCADAGVTVRHIRDAPAGARRLKEALPRPAFRSAGLQLPFVPGGCGTQDAARAAGGLAGVS